jgi:hypothetical protein
MAEGSAENERETAEGSKRRQRSDWFGQTLGAEWVEIEPGIYRHRASAPATPDDADPSLDEELMDAIPHAEQEAEAEPETSPPEHASQRRWFRR